MISRYFQKLLKKQLAESPYYGIMTDETTDISTTQQLILYVKYLKKDKKDNKFSLEIEYLNLVLPLSCDVGGITVNFTNNLGMPMLGHYFQNTERF